MAATNAATRKAANTVAAPDSSQTRLRQREGLTADDESGQDGRAGPDPDLDVPAVAVHLERRPGRCQSGGHLQPFVIATGGQPGGLPGSVDAPHLKRHRSDAGTAEKQHRNECRDGKRGFDSAGADIAD